MTLEEDFLPTRIEERTIESEWLKFARASAIPIGTLQWNESRKCFYAGFMVGIAAISEVIERVSSDEMTRDRGMELSSKWMEEIHHHMEEVRTEDLHDHNGEENGQ